MSEPSFTAMEDLNQLLFNETQYHIEEGLTLPYAAHAAVKTVYGDEDKILQWYIVEFILHHYGC